MKKGSIIAIFLGLWIALMFLVYWLMKKESITENIIYLVVVGSGFAWYFLLRMRQIPQMEAVIRKRKIEKRTVGEIIENTLVLIFSLLGGLSFWIWVLSVPIIPKEVASEGVELAVGLVALVILEKLYRKYKDRIILVVMIIMSILVLSSIQRVIGGFF